MLTIFEGGHLRKKKLDHPQFWELIGSLFGDGTGTACSCDRELGDTRWQGGSFCHLGERWMGWLEVRCCFVGWLCLRLRRRVEACWTEEGGRGGSDLGVYMHDEMEL